MTLTHNQRILNAHQRRLDILKKQHTALGVHAPAHFLIEIQDIENQIKKLGGTIEPYNPNLAPPKPTRVGTCPQCKAPIKLAPKAHTDESPFKIYSIRIGTDVECGHCGTVIPDQFAEQETVEPVTKPLTEPQSTPSSPQESVKPIQAVDEPPPKKPFLSTIRNLFSKKKRNY